MAKLKHVILKLLEERSLPPKNRNHKLKGNFKGYWECRIEPDLRKKISKIKTIRRI